MWDSVDAKGIDQVPVEGLNKLYIVVFMVLVVLLCLLFVNMFVGVVIKTYNEEKDHISYNMLLETHERSWINVQILTYQTKPVA